METTEFIWKDGAFVPWDEATVHVTAHGLNYGAGVFEGMRCYRTDRGPAVFRLRDHLNRLVKSAGIYLVTLPYSVDDLVAATKELVVRNGVEECYIRPLLWLGSGDLDFFSAPLHMSIACWPWDSYLGEDATTKGASVKVSSFRRIDPNVIPPAAKATGQYLNSLLAKLEALTGGYDEALLLNTAGFVTDGAGENVFIVRDGVLATPPTSSGALAGITRSSVITIARDMGFDVVEELLVRTDLYTADEAFFTGTAAEIVPIAKVDDRTVGLGAPGAITTKLREHLGAVMHGEVAELHHWLDWVR